ncbi:hypothetical protein [Bizionia sp. M204]|uniref:hypothetical protein n=1 Tax=unclassified Bizionia TaxID=2626393 RepID=UPI00206801E6|nr:hypothetical protein [Bizionia sp. M204]UPS92333.1 hypothetical protein GMA17_11640 [Bizionia sp. M204]
MIVNPQLFNYKLIIGSLVIAIVVLGSYGLTSYNTLKSQEEFMEQEIKLVQSELSNMMKLHDFQRVDNNELTAQLQLSKSKLETTLDSLNLVKTDYPLITKYKDDIATLIEERKILFNKIARLLDKNEALNEASKTNSLKLESSQVAIAALTEQNLELTAFVDRISTLTLDNLKVKAIITSPLEYNVETTKARQADNMEVCFTVLKNEFSSKGNKELYVQIIGPDNTIVSSRGVMEFGQEILAYSGRTAINYMNDDIAVCAKINVNQEKSLKKGDYLISVFHDNKVLGSSKIKLN